MKTWYTVSEISQVTNLTPRGVRKRSDTWEKRKREKGKGYEYHINSLPPETQAALALKEYRQSNPAPHPKAAAFDREHSWKRYGAVNNKQKEKAQLAFKAVSLGFELIAQGIKKGEAWKIVATQTNIGKSTIYNWRETVKGLHPSDWLAALTPKYVGRTKEAPCSDLAWEAFKTDYLRNEAPNIATCYDRVLRLANENNWQLPSRKTIERWVKTKIPKSIRVLQREGEISLMALYPPIERSVASLTAMQWINGDGYQHNVFVKFADGTIDRPKTWFWQDVHSRKILAYRIDITENTDQIRLAFSDVINQYGIPEHVTIDNTRAAANKFMTAGAENRRRFKAKDDDPIGMIPMLGCKVHWTSVNQAGTQAKGHGQAKPIERAFGVGGLGEHVDKHPAFAGAYTGNNPNAKPENYGSSAISLEQFCSILAQEIAYWNARGNRRTEMGANKYSFDDVFKSSYEKAIITKPTAEQKHLLLLTAESTKVKKDGTFTLGAGAMVGQGNYGRNRYYTSELINWEGDKIVARFDPEQLHESVLVYTLSGKFIATAQCLEALGFGDTETSRIYLKHRRQFIKATKEAAKAEQKLSLAEYASQITQQFTTPATEDITPAIVRMAQPKQPIEKAAPQQDQQAAKEAEPFLQMLKEQQQIEFQIPEDLGARRQLWNELDQQKQNKIELSELQEAFYHSFAETSDFEVGATLLEMRAIPLKQAFN